MHNQFQGVLHSYMTNYHEMVKVTGKVSSMPQFPVYYIS